MATQRIPNAPAEYSRREMQQVLRVIQYIVDQTTFEFQDIALQDWTVREETGTSYALTTNDSGRYIRFTAGSTVTVTLSTNDESVVGASIRMVQAGTGTVDLVPDAGVTVNTADGFKTRQQYSDMWLTKVGEDAWDLAGDLTA